MKIRLFLMRVRETAGPTMRRFWAAFIFCVMATAAFDAVVARRWQDVSQNPYRLALASILGFIISLCVILGWERRNAGGGSREDLQSNLLAVPTAGLATALAFVGLKDLGTIALSRHIGLCFAFVLVFVVIPHTRRESDLEMHIVRLFTQAVIAFLFAGVTTAGLSAITFTISSLFSLSIRSIVYTRLFLFGFGILAPFLFMAGIPRDALRRDVEDYPVVLRNLLLFAVIPLLGVYTAVLYVYFGKILVTRQWPVGLVAHLVLWYALMCTALLHFVRPIAPSNRIGDGFVRWFPRVVAPLLLMMFASVAIRIHHYGITENRYFVLVVGLWLLGASLFTWFGGSKKSAPLLLSLAVIIVLSVFGPWSSFSVSKWSQNRRLESILIRYDMVGDGGIRHPSKAVLDDDRTELAEVLRYFQRSHDLSEVRLLPQDFTMAQFADVFGFDYSQYPLDAVGRYFEYWAEPSAISPAGYDTVFDFTNANYGFDDPATVTVSEITVIYDRANQTVSVSRGGENQWEMSFAEYIGEIVEGEPSQVELNLQSEDTVIKATTPDLRLQMVITGFWAGSRGYEQDLQVHQVTFLLLVGVEGED